MTGLPRTLARARTPQGELALRERVADDGATVHELIVNGAFAMDSAEVASELALGDTLAQAAGPDGRVLLGGLGLGFTADRLLRHGVGELVIAELAEPLVAWARAGITDRLGRVAADPRVRLIAGDIAEELTAGGPGFGAIGLDVDNGPDFLIHEPNAALYGAPLLRAAYQRLVPGGLLAIWSERASPALAERLAALGRADTVIVPVRRDGHAIDYAIHRVRRAAGHPAE